MVVMHYISTSANMCCVVDPSSAALEFGVEWLTDSRVASKLFKPLSGEFDDFLKSFLQTVDTKVVKENKTQPCTYCCSKAPQTKKTNRADVQNLFILCLCVVAV